MISITWVTGQHSRRRNHLSPDIEICNTNAIVSRIRHIRIGETENAKLHINRLSDGLLRMLIVVVEST